MPDNKKGYIVFYKPVQLNAWFYIQVFLLLIVLTAAVYGVVMIVSGEGESRDWFSIFQIIIFISVSDRLIKQYKKSKVNFCFIAVDEEGVSWRLPREGTQAVEKNIIVWKDIKKVIFKSDSITIKYMSTYFTDTIPFDTINPDDKEQLLSVLRAQLSNRSIVSEDRLVA